MGSALCVIFDSVFLDDSASCSREDSLDECGRPCDALSCLLFSALWLRCNQSILVQETQSAKDIDMTCAKMLPIKATLAYKWGPCPWIGLLILLQDPIFPDLRCVLKFPAASNNEVFFQLPHVPVGDRMLFKRDRRYYNVLQGGMDVVLFFLKACGVLLGTPGLVGSVSSNKRTESSNSNVSKDSLTPTTFMSPGGAWKG